MTSNEHDAGLRAVARVRGVRERDSRIGLQQALATTRQREQEAARAAAQLAEAPAFVRGTSTDFHTQRTALAALHAQVRRSREYAESSRRSTEEARRRWQHDRGRLRAVESLLERREQARRDETARRETRELDDIAGRLWLRRQGRAARHDDHPFDGGDAA